jgi:hypothetical protein
VGSRACLNMVAKRNIFPLLDLSPSHQHAVSDIFFHFDAYEGGVW